MTDITTQVRVSNMDRQKQIKYDVGIIGVGVGANYGSVLTYYSLYKTIESFGKKTLMVSKIGAKKTDPEIQDTHAIRFANKHYNLSDIYSQETVKELNDIADTFVIGSDQVWNYGIAQHFGKAFYLDFASDAKRKISYAASFGHAKDFAPTEEVQKISSLMKRFNAISVREDSGVTIARDTYNVLATQVAEPIFLTSSEKYLELASSSTRDVSKPYLLAYILDPTPEKKEAIEHIAEKLNLSVRIILDAWPRLFQENKKKMKMDHAIEDNIEVYDFLKLYANCSYVVTDSFHGTAFALKFEKPFASIGNRRRGMARFDSMFRLIGNRHRFTVDPKKIVNDDERFLEPLDYAIISDRLDDHVNESKKWLKIALEKPVRNVTEHTNPNSINLRKSSKVTKKFVEFFKDQIKKERFRIKNPSFTSNNNAWGIEPLEGMTRLAVSGENVAVRGNLTWCDLPSPLRVDTAYEVSIEWVLRTASEIVNVHIRNPETGKFLVVGRVPAGEQVGVLRTDKMNFMVPRDGFSQIMLGAIHFTGVNAGADISSITVKSIRPGAVTAGQTSLLESRTGKAPAEVAKELRNVDNERFINAYAQKKIARNIGNSRSLMMFYSHGFEKGLSRTSDFRPGFGEASIAPLAKEMNQWVAVGRSTKDTFFQIAASVMHAYFERHKSLGIDVSHFRRLFSASVQKEIQEADADIGGAFTANTIREAEISDDQKRSFIDIAFARRSVREFISTPVAESEIQRAVQIAIQSPSVCNRQPARVHQFDNADVMRAVLDLQGGFRGYKMPPRLLLVTCDLKAYLFAVERNQAFIDGGLFMMMLLLGLEQVGLGACSLNTAMSKEREAAVRKILKIPESEVFISFIGVGHFDPSVLVPRSKRVPLEEVLVQHVD